MMDFAHRFLGDFVSWASRSAAALCGAGDRRAGRAMGTKPGVREDSRQRNCRWQGELSQAKPLAMRRELCVGEQSHWVLPLISRHRTCLQGSVSKPTIDSADLDGVVAWRSTSKGQ